MAKKQNSIEDYKRKHKRNIWAIVILVVLLLISGSYNASNDANTQTKIEDTKSCLDTCEVEYGIDVCSSWTGAGDRYSDILEDKDELQDCLDEFSSCVNDCKENLE